MPRAPKDPSAPKKPRAPRKKADAPVDTTDAPADQAPGVLPAVEPGPVRGNPEAADPVTPKPKAGRKPASDDGNLLKVSAPAPEAAPTREADEEPLVVKASPLPPRAPMAPPNEDTPAPEAPEKPRVVVEPRTLNLHELQPMPIGPLAEVAKHFGIENYGTLKRQEIIFQIVQRNLAAGGIINTRGVLEVMPEGFGFLRSPAFNYLPCPEDIYVSPSQIRRFDLATGDDVEGQVRPPKDKEKFYALLRWSGWPASTPTRPRRRPTSRISRRSFPTAASCSRPRRTSTAPAWWTSSARSARAPAG
jgi:transcription termination factor Rho